MGKRVSLIGYVLLLWLFVDMYTILCAKKELFIIRQTRGRQMLKARDSQDQFH